ncbi:hypothetical protein M413DRAFT_159705 [Hebeloma cylindrosporum]|uniref:Uncharacterized protein n=1 Tax=Hebeloma cylindrosporum TaxID=76867 RepID=A0A0C3CA93_HEBCY|nr:hypothetical protein M413DRAFT_159705 [Hebeloma cylindrosporum h7]
MMLYTYQAIFPCSSLYRLCNVIRCSIYYFSCISMRGDSDLGRGLYDCDLVHSPSRSHRNIVSYRSLFCSALYASVSRLSTDI